ncbi:hypothetical protein [Nocardia beijingensis]|uniref:hypothetical protein n=1 Tax=Nocardia beijingensis TaxID=95162 RepID=UPI0012F525DD|nr:hypothetical protein [Nocardia beijingensis]
MASATGYATARALDAPSRYAIANVLAPDLLPRGSQHHRRSCPRAVSMSSPRTLWIKPSWIEPTGDSQCGVIASVGATDFHGVYAGRDLMIGKNR